MTGIPDRHPSSRGHVAPSHADAVVAEHLRTWVEGVVPHRFDPGFPQPREQQWPGADVDDSELDELVGILIDTAPFELPKDVVPETHFRLLLRQGP